MTGMCKHSCENNKWEKPVEKEEKKKEKKEKKEKKDKKKTNTTGEYGVFGHTTTSLQLFAILYKIYMAQNENKCYSILWNCHG